MMKILVLCTCNHKLALNQSNNGDFNFKGTCRICHREHRVQAEIKDYSILKKPAPREKTGPNPDLDKWFQEAQFTTHAPRLFIPATYPRL